MRSAAGSTAGVLATSVFYSTLTGAASTTGAALLKLAKY